MRRAGLVLLGVVVAILILAIAVYVLLHYVYTVGLNLNVKGIAVLALGGLVVGAAGFALVRSKGGR